MVFSVQNIWGRNNKTSSPIIQFKDKTLIVGSKIENKLVIIIYHVIGEEDTLKDFGAVVFLKWNEDMNNIQE